MTGKTDQFADHAHQFHKIPTWIKNRKHLLLLSRCDMVYFNTPWKKWAWSWYDSLKGIHYGKLLSWA
jgi:hypothetical protein